MKRVLTITDPVHLFLLKALVDVSAAAVVAGAWYIDPFNRFFKGTGIDAAFGNDKLSSGESIQPRELFSFAWIVVVASSAISVPLWRFVDPCVSDRATVSKCASTCKGDPDWKVLLAILLVDLLLVVACCLVLLLFRWFVGKPFVTVGFTLIWGAVLAAIVAAIRLSIEIGAMLFDGETAMLAYLPEPVANALKKCAAVTTKNVLSTHCGKTSSESSSIVVGGNSVPRTLGKLVVLNAQYTNLLLSMAIAFLIGVRMLVMYAVKKKAEAAAGVPAAAEVEAVQTGEKAPALSVETSNAAQAASNDAATGGDPAEAPAEAKAEASNNVATGEEPTETQAEAQAEAKAEASNNVATGEEPTETQAEAKAEAKAGEKDAVQNSTATGEAPAGVEAQAKAQAEEQAGVKAEAPAGEKDVVQDSTSTGEAPAGVQEGEAPDGVQEGEAPAGVQEGETTAGVQEGETTAGVQEGEAPDGVQEGEAPDGVQEGEAPAEAPDGVQADPEAVAQADPEAVAQAAVQADPEAVAQAAVIDEPEAEAQAAVIDEPEAEAQAAVIAEAPAQAPAKAQDVDEDKETPTPRAGKSPAPKTAPEQQNDIVEQVSKFISYMIAAVATYNSAGKTPPTVAQQSEAPINDEGTAKVAEAQIEKVSESEQPGEQIKDAGPSEESQVSEESVENVSESEQPVEKIETQVAQVEKEQDETRQVAVSEEREESK